MSSDSSSAAYHLSQLLGQDYWKRELKDEQVHRVLSRLRPSVRQWLKMKEILPLLSKRPVLIGTEMQHLETTRPTDQASVLVDFLMNKGMAGIERLYVCLMESSEQVPSHYQLAGELKRIVQAELGITASSDLAAVSSTHQQQQSLHSRVKKLYQIPLDADSAQSFTANLGLSAAHFETPPTSFQAVCQRWLSQSSAPGDMDQLVEALVSTRGLGRHTSCLCSPASSVPLEVRNFLLSLGERWVELARFLGFSEEEVGAITEAHTSSIEQQVVEFLKVWQLPECGQRTLPLMHKLKGLAGIVEPKKKSRRLANRPVGEMALKQEHGHKPRESWRLSSLEPPKEKKQEQSQWERSVSDSAYTGGWQFDPFIAAVSGSPMKQEQKRQEQKHNPEHHTSLPLKEKEQKSISDSANSGDTTEQTGATASQSETDLHESSAPSTVPSDTQTRASPALSAASFASTDSEVSAKKPLLTICDTEWDKLCKRASELGTPTTVIECRCDSVYQIFLKWTPSHYWQGPLEPSTTQPSIEGSTHTQLSSTKNKNIGGLINPALTSGEQPTEGKDLKQRQSSKIKQMQQTVKRGDLFKKKIRSSDYPQEPSEYSSIQKPIYKQKSFSRSKDIRNLMKQKLFKELCELCQIMEQEMQSVSHSEELEEEFKEVIRVHVPCESLVHKTQSVSHFEELRELFKEVFRDIIQRLCYPENYMQMDCFEEVVSNDVSQNNGDAHFQLVLQLGVAHREIRRLREEIRYLRQSQRQENLSPVNETQVSTHLLQSTSNQECPRSSEGSPSASVPRDQAGGRPSNGQSTGSSPPSGVPPTHSGTQKESERRVELAQNGQDPQEGCYVLSLHHPMTQMLTPILVVSISRFKESTQRLLQKLERDYGHRFALDSRFPVRFTNTTATITVVSRPKSCEVLKLQYPTEITKEEVETNIRSADDLPPYITFQLKVNQECITVHQNVISVRLGVNELDKAYEFEPVIAIDPCSPSTVKDPVSLCNDHSRFESTAVYYKLQRKRDTIISHLAQLRITAPLVEKLLKEKMITNEIYEQAKNFAPGTGETDRATVLFNAVLAGVELNPAKYYNFIGILREIWGSDDLVAHIEECSMARSDAMATPSDSRMATTQSIAMKFTAAELKLSTGNFSKERQIGEGAFGCVYLAKNLRSTGTHAAVKVLSQQGQKSISEKFGYGTLDAELKALTRYRHCNLVQLMGYSCNENLSALVYEFLPRRSLYQNLHSESTKKLSLDERVQILTDVCRGLAYLHGSCPPLIHQDIKSHNILLDEGLIAKLGDFGFSMEKPQSSDGRTLITAPMLARSNGYIPPELSFGKISPKSDVYSYGIVVLETFMGQVAFDTSREEPELAAHTEDSRASIDDFLTLADPSFGNSAAKNLNVVTTFYNIVRKSLSRHGKRATSAEIMELWNIDHFK